MIRAKVSLVVPKRSFVRQLKKCGKVVGTEMGMQGILNKVDYFRRSPTITIHPHKCKADCMHEDIVLWRVEGDWKANE